MKASEVQSIKTDYDYDQKKSSNYDVNLFAFLWCLSFFAQLYDFCKSDNLWLLNSQKVSKTQKVSKI